jgi:hypothetical protein
MAEISSVGGMWMFSRTIHADYIQKIFSQHRRLTFSAYLQWKIETFAFFKELATSVRCPLTIWARMSGRNFAKFDQRNYWNNQ